MLILDYPLKVAKLQTLNREQRRSKRLGFEKDAWWKKKQDRYSRVKLVKQNGLWGLIYATDSTMTGGFKTKQEAVKWYAKGGR